jgi:superfamily II DNA or RNA helicase
MIIVTNIHIKVRKIDEVYLHLECAENIKAELAEYFSFFAPNYQFNPLYKKKVWNGKIYLFNRKKSLLFAGLMRYLNEFGKEKDYAIDYEDTIDVFNEFSLEEAKEFATSLSLHSQNKPIEPRDYQLTAFAKAIRYQKILMLSPTASGKSLIIYLIMRKLLQENCKRGLLIVPTVSLVEQMYSDFQDYSTANKWEVSQNCQKIYQGQDKLITRNLVISTWQSLIDMPKKFFEQFDFVIGDEAHGYDAKSLSKIMTRLVNAKYRIGTTGTIKDTKVHKLSLEAYFGAISKIITTKELIDRKQLADFEIKCLTLKYPESVCSQIKNCEYQEEIDFLVSNEARNKFITDLAINLNGNTLILFTYVEKHGKILYELIKEKRKERKIFFVFGGTDVLDREAIRSIVEKEKDAIIVASYGVYSTGVNIRNLHNIIFASPSKSKIRNLQSIGRGLRLSEEKEKAVLYDISDDLRINNYVNFTLKHFAERLKLYHEEKFKISTYKIELKYAEKTNTQE